MTGKNLPYDHHIVRYVKPTLIEEGTVDGGAFVLRADELGLSVNWLEILGGTDHHQQVDEVRRLSRLRLARRGGFAMLNVGETKRHVSDGAQKAGFQVNPSVCEAPLAAADGFEADPSHSEFTGLPSADSNKAMLVGDLIADCVKYPLFPGKVD